MRALYFDGQLQMRDLPRPEPGPGEALVRVRLAGICRTDLEVLKGYHGFRGIPGHEFVGVVEGPPSSPFLGQRVVGEINIGGCGECDHCFWVSKRHCQHRRVLGLLGKDGAFAEYLTLPESNLHLVPEELPDEAAVFTEPLAAALAAEELLEGLIPAPILVIGDGPLGLLISFVFGLQGFPTILVGHHPEHLQLAAAYGVETFLEAELPAREFGVVVEASGSPSGLELALARVHPQGLVIVKSIYAGKAPLSLTDLVVKEVKLVGSRCGPFGRALAFLTKGGLDPRPLIAGIFPFSEALTAISRAQGRGTLKILLDLSA